ncbi:hypothetical protein ACSBR2_023242 [Camellia fascicularis]
MFRVCQKLRQLKASLKILNKKDFGDISIRVQASKASLDLVQFKLDRDPGNLELQVQERKEFKNYLDLSKVEECLALQKSRVQWLGLGDKNSSFFFRSVISNINRGKILSVNLGDGTRSTESAVIHDTFVQFYTNLFGSSFKDQYNGLERIQSLVKTKVSLSQSANLARPIKEWISSTPPALYPSNSLDTPVWSLNADGVFSIHSTWDYWRDKGPKVPWSKMIWGPPLIPRVSFVVWLAINERLNTGDKL